jgi:hypothetical protein
MRALLFSLASPLSALFARGFLRLGRSAAGLRLPGPRCRLRQAKAENKPILLYFGRYGCAWCDHVNRKTFSDTGLRQLFSDNYVLIYVDAEGGKRIRLPSGERLTEGELGVRLGAYATPLFVFMTPEGKVVAKIPGFKTVAISRITTAMCAAATTRSRA